MKKLLLVLVLPLTMNVSCAYKRIGDFTMLSNRNVDKSTQYVLLERDVVKKMKTKKKDYMELAVDDAVRGVNGGEYLMNVKLYVSRSGRKLKLVADVWGIKEN